MSMHRTNNLQQLKRMSLLSLVSSDPDFARLLLDDDCASTTLVKKRKTHDQATLPVWRVRPLDVGFVATLQAIKSKPPVCFASKAVLDFDVNRQFVLTRYDIGARVTRYSYDDLFVLNVADASCLQSFTEPVDPLDAVFFGADRAHLCMLLEHNLSSAQRAQLTSATLPDSLASVAYCGMALTIGDSKQHRAMLVGMRDDSRHVAVFVNLSAVYNILVRGRDRPVPQAHCPQIATHDTAQQVDRLLAEHHILLHRVCVSTGTEYNQWRAVLGALRDCYPTVDVRGGSLQRLFCTLLQETAESWRGFAFDWNRFPTEYQLIVDALRLPANSARRTQLLLLLAIGPTISSHSGCWLGPSARLGEACYYLYRAFTRPRQQPTVEFAHSSLPLAAPIDLPAVSSSTSVAHHPFLCEIRSAHMSRAEMLRRRRDGHACCNPTHCDVVSSAANRRHAEIRSLAEKQFGLKPDDSLDQRAHKLRHSGWLASK